MEAIATRVAAKRGNARDVVIVGAGPSGIAASLSAKERKLDFVTVEQDTLGGTVASFPRRKLVMTAPATLPLIGKVKFTETTKEALLEFWQKVERSTGLTINYGERLEKVERKGDVFEVRTTKGSYTARAVLLAIGRRGTPRKLGVPGEELTKVTYRLSDPAQYRGMHVLVVGGGDSALERGGGGSEQPDTTVTLSYRSATFNRAKRRNRQRIEHAAASGRLTVLLESNVTRIEPTEVELEQRGAKLRVRNDAIIVNAGGILPTPFLKEIGIEVETKYGTR
jgi:thioredoxin reductase